MEEKWKYETLKECTSESVKAYIYVKEWKQIIKRVNNSKSKVWMCKNMKLWKYKNVKVWKCVKEWKYEKLKVWKCVNRWEYKKREVKRMKEWENESLKM